MSHLPTKIYVLHEYDELDYPASRVIAAYREASTAELRRAELVALRGPKSTKHYVVEEVELWG